MVNEMMVEHIKTRIRYKSGYLPLRSSVSLKLTDLFAHLTNRAFIFIRSSLMIESEFYVDRAK